MLRRAALALLCSAAALFALPARAEGAAAPLSVLAAASLSEALQAVAQAWQAQGNGAVTLSFDGSSRLARQVEAGMPADAFFSADLAWMDHLDRQGLLQPGSQRALLGNSLVAVVRRDAVPVPASAADLAGPGIERLALAGENVPAGRYARAALASLGAWQGVADRVVVGDDVRTALAWVATGEAQAGVVYATDARVEPRVQVAFPFPAGSHPPIVYPAAVLRGAAHPQDAARFLDFCQSAQARALFAAAGFTMAGSTPTGSAAAPAP